MLDGWEVRGLDQTGLSQKAGPVVSDLRLTRGAPAPQSRLGTAQADVLLALDLLVAASPRALTATHPGTRVVGSTTLVPTAHMVVHPEDQPDRGALLAAIEEATGDEPVWADVGRLVEGLLDTTSPANVFVLGMAVQAGVVPVDPARIVEAIELNGVAVETNLAAFTWGRWYVADPDRVRAAAEPPPTAPVALPLLDEAPAARIAAVSGDDDALHEALVLRAHDLVGFQDRRLAESWLATIEEVAAAENAVAPGSTRLTRTVAEQLHHLCAYKDEYEVARLMLDPDGVRPAAEVAGPDGRIAWKLHPPLLRAMGLDRKITLGPWARPAIAALARAKRLRGTALDPFGKTAVRRLERRLPDEYRACVATLLEHLDADRLDEAVRIAGSSDSIRGFEDLKVRRAEAWRQQVAVDLEAYRRGAPAPA
ncbi:MAG: hypothetical protein D6683_11260 [Actinomyces sp.]|nr:MAG: hypothetical protein D6683_11260 [Actinomyces sp.]